MFLSGRIVFGLMFLLLITFILVDNPVECRALKIVLFRRERDACPRDSYYDSKHHRCRPFPGGGTAIFIDYKKRCADDMLGPRSHSSGKQYYYVCKRDSVVFGKCPDFCFFDDYSKSCRARDDIPISLNDITPICKREGKFPISSNCTLYYVCKRNRKGSFHKDILSCPHRTNFSPLTRKCDGGYKCRPKVINPDFFEGENEEERFPICKWPGRFRSPSDCSSYYTCEESRSGRLRQKRYRCADGSLYDIKKEMCRPMNRVDCRYMTESEILAHYMMEHKHDDSEESSESSYEDYENDEDDDEDEEEDDNDGKPPMLTKPEIVETTEIPIIPGTTEMPQITTTSKSLTKLDPGQTSNGVTTSERTEEAAADESIPSLPEVTSTPTGATVMPEMTPMSDTPSMPETTSMLETHSMPETTPMPETTLMPETTPIPKTFPIPETSPQPETSPMPEMSPTPETFPMPETTPTPETSPTSPTPETSPIPKTTPMPERTPIPKPKTTSMPDKTPIPKTTPMSETTSIQETTSMPETTPMPKTTPLPETTTIPETTIIPKTTIMPDTTEMPKTFTLPETTSIPEATSTLSTPIKPGPAPETIAMPNLITTSETTTRENEERISEPETTTSKGMESAQASEKREATSRVEKASTIARAEESTTPKSPRTMTLPNGGTKYKKSSIILQESGTISIPKSTPGITEMPDLVTNILTTSNIYTISEPRKLLEDKIENKPSNAIETPETKKTDLISNEIETPEPKTEQNRIKTLQNETNPNFSTIAEKTTERAIRTETTPKTRLNRQSMILQDEVENVDLSGGSETIPDTSTLEEEMTPEELNKSKPTSSKTISKYKSPAEENDTILEENTISSLVKSSEIEMNTENFSSEKLTTTPSTATLPRTTNEFPPTTPSSFGPESYEIQNINFDQQNIHGIQIKTSRPIPVHFVHADTPDSFTEPTFPRNNLSSNKTSSKPKFIFLEINGK